MLFLTFILLQTIVFVVIFFLLKRLMYQNTQSALNRLQIADEENEKRLKELKEKVKEEEDNYQKKLAAVEQDTEQQKRTAKQEIDVEKTKILTKAREEASALLEAAKTKSTKTEREAKLELEKRAATLGAELLKKLLSETAQEAFHALLVDDLIKEVELLDGKSMPSQVKKIEAISRFPLKTPQKAKLKDLFEKKLGGTVTIEEKIKKDMVGGVIVTIGSLVLDGSVENRLKEMTEED